MVKIRILTHRPAGLGCQDVPAADRIRVPHMDPVAWAMEASGLQLRIDVVTEGALGEGNAEDATSARFAWAHRTPSRASTSPTASV